MEFVFIATFEDAKKVFWFRKFVMELSVMSSDAITLYYDNYGTIAPAKKPRFHQKSKQIEDDFTIYMTISCRSTSRCRK